MKKQNQNAQLTTAAEVLDKAQTVLKQSEKELASAKEVSAQARLEAEETMAFANEEARELRNKAKIILACTIIGILLAVVISIIVWFALQPKYSEAIKEYDATVSYSDYIIPRRDSDGTIFILVDNKRIDLPQPSEEWLNQAIKTLDEKKEVNFFSEQEKFAAKYLSLEDKLKEYEYYDFGLSAGQAIFCLSDNYFKA